MGVRTWRLGNGRSIRRKDKKLGKKKGCTKVWIWTKKSSCDWLTSAKLPFSPAVFIPCLYLVQGQPYFHPFFSILPGSPPQLETFYFFFTLEFWFSCHCSIRVHAILTSAHRSHSALITQECCERKGRRRNKNSISLLRLTSESEFLFLVGDPDFRMLR